MIKNKRVLFLTLKIFSTTGGIEKVCRILGKALYELSIENQFELAIFSMYDSPNKINNYFPNEISRSFNQSKFSFSIHAILEGKKSNIIILSHINLLLIGWFIKKMNPKSKLILLAHGIEVWKKFAKYKRFMLKSCDLIIPVSNYTSKKMQELHQVESQKCMVLNNCLDPFLFPKRKIPYNYSKNFLKEKLGFNTDDIIIFTLSRLSSKERYKGYDSVICTLKKITSQLSNVKYLIVGGFDKDEKLYLENLAKKNCVFEKVILKGFVSDEELFKYFQISDLYIMPSVKEGFGIVFIEAMYYNLPVIAGNKDGSVDALLNGEMGILIDPNDQNEIEKSILNVLNGEFVVQPSFKKLIDNFSFEKYKKNVNDILFRY